MSTEDRLLAQAAEEQQQAWLIDWTVKFIEIHEDVAVLGYYVDNDPDVPVMFDASNGDKLEVPYHIAKKALERYRDIERYRYKNK